jgi:hypothetical protein
MDIAIYIIIAIVTLAWVAVVSVLNYFDRRNYKREMEMREKLNMALAKHL